MPNELTTSATLKAQLMGILNEVIHEDTTVHRANVRISAKGQSYHIDDLNRVTDLKVSDLRDVNISISYSINR